MASASWRDELQESKSRCLLTGNEYIRLDAIYAKVTAARVRELPVAWYRQCRLSRGRHLDEKVQRARKVVALFVILGKYDCIHGILKDGLTDDDLPLLRKSDNTVQTRSGRNILESFKTCQKHQDLSAMLFEIQGLVLAPMLDLQPGRCVDIALPESSGLPFLCQEISSTDYSTVYKGELWASHRKTLTAETNDGDHNQLFAIKKFKKKDHFSHELKNLQALKEIESDYIIKHFATCESALCIFFPWADGGDLCDFWRRENTSLEEPERAPEIFLWVLQQITNLTEALRDIHGKGCRHGDLKPSNILHFPRRDGKPGALRLADFGVSKVHDKPTLLRSAATSTKASTFTYEAPEANEHIKEKQPRSRKYDCWPLGCIMLEFIIWLLYGENAVTSFRISREVPYRAYYRCISGADQKEMAMTDAFEIVPSVNEAIAFLTHHPRIRETALRDVIELVQSGLLLIEPNKRHSAADAYDMLNNALGKARDDSESFSREVEENLAIPAIFTRPASWEQPQTSGIKPQQSY